MSTSSPDPKLRFTSEEAKAIYAIEDALLRRAKLEDLIYRKLKDQQELNNQEERFLVKHPKILREIGDILQKNVYKEKTIQKGRDNMLGTLQDIQVTLKSSLALEEKISDSILEQVQGLTHKAVEAQRIAKTNKESLSVHKSISVALSEEVDKYKNVLSVVTSTGRGAESAAYTLANSLRGIEDMETLLNLGATEAGFSSLAEEAGAMSEVLKKIAQTEHSITDLTGLALDQRKQVLQSVRDHLATEKAILVTMQNEVKLSQEFHSRIDSINGSINAQFTRWQAIAKVLPGFYSAFGSKMANVQAALTDSVTGIGNALRTGQGLGSAVGKSLGRITEALGKQSKLMGVMGVAALAYGAALFYGAKNAFDTYMKLVSTSKEVSQAIGLSNRQSYALAKNSFNATLSNVNHLSVLEDMVGVQKSLTGEYGRTMNISDKVTAQIADSAKVYGYSAEEAGKLQGTFLELGRDNEVVAGNLQVMTAQYAEANKLAPGLITKDLVENSKTVMLNFAGMPEKASKAAVEVRKMGYSLATASKVQDHLFQVESSLTAQMEASVGLNRMIDLSKARQYALTGDLVSMMEEMARQGGSYEQYVNSSVPQRILLARAMGMEVEEFARSLYIQKFKNKFTEKELKLIHERKDQFKDIEGMSEAAVRAQLDQVNAQDAINAQMGKLKGELAKALLPAIETIAGLIVKMAPAIGKLASALGVFLQPLGWIAQLIQDIFGDGGEGLAGGIAKLGQSVKDSFTDAFSGGNVFLTIAKSALLIFGAMTASIGLWKILIRPFVSMLGLASTTLMNAVQGGGKLQIPGVQKMSRGAKLGLGLGAATVAGTGIYEAYKYFTRDVEAGTEEAKKALEQSGNTAEQEVPGMITNSFGGGSGFEGALGAAVSTAMSLAFLPMPEWATKGIKKGMGKMGSKVASVLGEGFNAIGDSAIGKVSKFGGVAKSIGSKLLGSGAVETAAAAGADMLTGAGSSTVEQSQSASKKAKQTSNKKRRSPGRTKKRKKGKSSGISGATSGLAGGAAAGGIEVMTQVTDAAGSIGSVGAAAGGIEVMTQVADAVGSIGSVGVASGAGITSFLTGLAAGLSSLANPAAAIGAGILAVFVLAFGAALRIAAPAIEKLAPVLTQAVKSLGEILVAAVQQIGPILHGLADVFLSIGKALAAPIVAIANLMYAFTDAWANISFIGLGAGLGLVARGVWKLRKAGADKDGSLHRIYNFMQTMSKFNGFSASGFDQTVTSITRLTQIQDASILDSIAKGLTSISAALQVPSALDIGTIFNLATLTEVPGLSLVEEGMAKINKALQLTGEDVKPINLEALNKLTGVKTADGLTLVAEGIREIGKALRTIDTYVLDTLALLASMTFINRGEAKSSSKSIDLTDALPAPVKAIATTVTPQRWLSDRMNTSSEEEFIESRRASYGAQKPVTTSSDPNISKMVRLFEQYLNTPPTLAVSFDDGALKTLNVALRRANN